MNEWPWRLLEERPPAPSITIGGAEVRPGDRVRLRPDGISRRATSDVFDLALAGRTAVVHSIEQDYEGVVQLTVVLEDDPGSDLGLLRQVGHRFFFRPDEVEPLDRATESGSAGPSAPGILVAGIGNIFLGDDGFGVEVAQRLARRSWPPGVRVIDFGIRGVDLVYALQDSPDVTILVDAHPRGGAPGSVYLVEPDLDALANDGAPPSLDPHAMDPMAVLRMARASGGTLERVVLVGCEPATLGPLEGRLGLSDAVQAAVAEAEAVVVDLVDRIRGRAGPGEWVRRHA